MPKYNYQYENNHQEYARKLRKNMTRQEQKLWYQFLRRYPVKFYRQRRIGNYIVDFYCASAKLIIELDGGQHFEADGMVNDEVRTRELTGIGLQVIRYTNAQIDRHFEAVCEDIDRIVRLRTPPPLWRGGRR